MEEQRSKELYDKIYGLPVIDFNILKYKYIFIYSQVILGQM